MNQELITILNKFALGQTTAEENDFFNKWLQAANEADYEMVLDLYQSILVQNSYTEDQDLVLLQKITQSILDYPEYERKPKVNMVRNFARIAVAAALIGSTILTALWYYEKPTSGLVEKQAFHKNDVVPGTNKAVLTLSNGSQVLLSNSKRDIVLDDKNGVIGKNRGGQLIYTRSGNSARRNTITNVYNTIMTPRAGQYQVVLSDGTKVWLNAESSIKFPVTFIGSKREVELTGEAYFEVTKSPKPFRVISREQAVEVLGTHFNINTYPEENITKTTLLEGAVKITKGLEKIQLRPGQESKIVNGRIEVTDDADIQAAIAWKNGEFQFNDTDLKSIMRQLERWYDLDVNYADIPATRFNGSISRNVNVSKVLKMLELTGKIHFKLDGRRVSIMH